MLVLDFRITGIVNLVYTPAPHHVSSSNVPHLGYSMLKGVLSQS